MCYQWLSERWILRCKNSKISNQSAQCKFYTKPFSCWNILWLYQGTVLWVTYIQITLSQMAIPDCYIIWRCCSVCSCFYKSVVTCSESLMIHEAMNHTKFIVMFKKIVNSYQYVLIRAKAVPNCSCTCTDSWIIGCVRKAKNYRAQWSTYSWWVLLLSPP